jgi:hypothetical protein
MAAGKRTRQPFGLLGKAQGDDQRAIRVKAVI